MSSFSSLEIRQLVIGYAVRRGEASFQRSSLAFTACRGEITALTGPNGSGKSTLLRTIAGLQKPLGGEVLLDGRPMAGITRRELARTISFVSTEHAAPPAMTVADMVASGRYPYTNWRGTAAEEDRRKVSESLANTGLTPLAFRPVSRLSDGEYQRVLIARALAQDTPFILLDEPTAFLDINNKFAVFHLLKQLAAGQNKTIVLSTHDLEIALREMDKLWIMTSGVVREGAPEDAILNGWLELLSGHPQVGFDPGQGRFRFERPPEGKVMLRGEGLPLEWTRRAFERKGYTAGNTGDAALSVVVRDERPSGKLVWDMTRAGETRRFSSVHGLMRALG